MQQSEPLTLRRNFSWTFIGNGVYAACQWGILVLLAKIGTPEMVGQFSLGLSITAPVVMFTNLQLSAIQVTDAKQEFAFTDYLSLRLIMAFFAIMMVMVITIAGGYRLETSFVIIGMGLAKAIESVSEVFYSLLQHHERMDRISISMMIKGCLSLLLLGVGVYLTQSVFWGVVGLIVAWTIVLVGYDLHSGQMILNSATQLPQGMVSEKRNLAGLLKPSLHPETQKRLVRLALPLGFVMMLISLNNNIPRYFIEHFLGEKDLGIFTAIAYLMVATSMVVGALGQSAGPRLAKYYAAANNPAFRKLLIQLITIGLLLGGIGVLIVLLVGRPILTIVYNEEYAKHANLLVWLMVATSINHVGSFLGNGMSAVRYFKVQLPLFTVVTSASAAVSFWLIPRMGLQGAANALIFSAVIQVVLSFGVIAYALSRHYHQLTEIQGRNVSES
jgi:O-antigen/teichoic acid export membrane protein